MLHNRTARCRTSKGRKATANSHNYLRVCIAFGPLCIWARCDDVVFDATLVVTTANAEVALFRPMWVPRVCDLPIFHSILDTPANHFDSMTTRHLASHMMVDATSVVFKVRIHCEG